MTPGGLAISAGNIIRFRCAICTAWLIGLPRRAGRRLHAVNDTEAPQWDWQVTERRGGLVHQYRDARFEALKHDPGLRREEFRGDGCRPDGAQLPSADAASGGDA